MKNLFIICLVSYVLFSCQKETFTPNQFSSEEALERKVSDTKLIVQNEIEVLLLFEVNEPQLQGEVRIYFDDSLAYTIDASTLTFEPYGDEGIAKATKITVPCSNKQLIDANRWFWVQADFLDTVEYMFNENKFNGKMTFCNESTILPEPSFIFKENFTSFSNAFFVKRPTPAQSISNSSLL